MNNTTTFASIVAAACLCVTPALAQNEPERPAKSGVQTKTQQVHEDVNQSGNNAATAAERGNRERAAKVTGLGQMDDVTAGDSIRVSELIGANIYDMNGDDIGDINDMVVDGNGQIRYVAVSYGGFLGIGDKLFAVPFKAFKTKRDNDGDHYLTLDITQERLEGATGFDQDNWPNFADQSFTQSLDKMYRVPQTTR